MSEIIKTDTKEFKVFTNKIANITKNISRVAKKYAVFSVEIIAQKNFKQILMDISQQAASSCKIFASYFDRENSIKYFLVSKQTEIKIDVQDTITSKTKISKLDNFILEKLLFKSVPRLLNSKTITDYKAFVYDDNYYRAIGPANQFEDHDSIIANEVSLSRDFSLDTTDETDNKIIKIKTVTFTHVKSIKLKLEKAELLPESKKKSYLIKRYNYLLSVERFDLSKSDFIIKNSIKQGEYVKCNITNKKGRSNAYIIDHDGDTKDPSLTKVGMINTFIEDLHKVHDGNIKVTLEQETFNKCYLPTKLATFMKWEYKLILEKLEKYNIVIINKSNNQVNASHIKLIKQEIAKLKGNINFLLQEENYKNNKNDLTLLIVDNKKKYKNKVDPYLAFKNNNFEVISQAVEYENLFKIKKDSDEISVQNSVLECIIKEFVVKIEVENEQLMYERLAKLPKNYEYITAVRVDNNEDEIDDKQQSTDYKYEYYKVTLKTTKKITKLKFKKMSNKECELLAAALGDKKHLVFGKEKIINKQLCYGHQRNPLMFNPKTNEHIIFVKKEISALPNHQALKIIRHRLKKDRQKTVSREFLINYIQQQDTPSNNKYVLNKMLEDNQTNQFTYEILKEYCKVPETIFSTSTKKLTNAEKYHVLDYIKQKLNYLWRDTTKQQKNLNRVIHQQGLNYNHETKRYYAGMVGSYKYKPQQNFCTIYEIVDNVKQGLPSDIINWFLSLSVRHKQTTVYPFIFKHLREYAYKTQFIATPNQLIKEPPSIKIKQKHGDKPVKTEELVLDF
jgi:hypothetical protein